MDSATLPTVPQFILDQTITDATIQAMTSLSEGLLISFESLTGDGVPLTDTQQICIMQTMMFVFREYESKLRESADFLLMMTESLTNMDVDDLLDAIDLGEDDNKAKH